jgi:hypothetical protein
MLNSPWVNMSPAVIIPRRVPNVTVLVVKTVFKSL